MDPVLMQQILGAGPLAEQGNQLDQQLQEAILRRRAMNAQPTKTGLGAALGGIADVIAGNKENALRSRQADLAKQIAGVRGQYGNAWLGTPMGPEAPPGMVDNPPRVPPSVADQSQLATLGELSGDPVMAKVGQGALARAQQAPKLALETEQARKVQQGNAAMETPQASAAMRILLHKYGVDAPEGTPSATLQALLPIAEKGFSAEQQAQARRDALAAMNTRFEINTGTRQDQYGNKRFKELADAINPMLPRGGLKNYADTINRAQKLGALLTENGEVKRLLTPQDMTEAAIALQGMVANGHASQGEVEALIPKSAGADAARLGQYFTGNPWNAQQQTWALRMLHTAQREADTNRNTIVANIRQKLPQFSDLRQSEKDRRRLDNVLKGAGIDPTAFDDDLLPVDGKEMLTGTNPVLSGNVGGGAQHSAAVAKVKNDAEFDALPPGTTFIGPDGKTRKKP